VSVEQEAWRSVVGHPLYEISDRGRVRSWAKKGPAGGVLATPRMLRQETMHMGHRRVNLGKGRRQTVHVLVLEAFVGPRNGSDCARHLNGDPADNRADNLAWGSFFDNEADKRAHGRSLIGERHHQALLNDADVVAIRASNEVGTVLAGKHGVSPSTIWLIRKGRTWKHLLSA